MRNWWAEAGCYAADRCFVRFNDNTMMKCIGMDDILCINTDLHARPSKSGRRGQN